MRLSLDTIGLLASFGDSDATDCWHYLMAKLHANPAWRIFVRTQDGSIFW